MKRTQLLITGAMLLATTAGCAPLGQTPALPDGPITMPLQARLVSTTTRGIAFAEDRTPWNLAQISRQHYTVAAADSRDVVVAIMDTGIDSNHPQLVGRLLPGLDVVGRDVYVGFAGDTDYTGVDGNGHGTHVAGIVAQVAQGTGVRILPVKVIPNSGVGDDKLLTEGIEQALAWRDPANPNARVRIMNLSVSSPRVSERLKAVIKKATDQGVMVIAASGNEGRAVEFPATMSEVLSVGATTVEDAVADYSCFGDAIDVAAPGGSDETPVFSTWPTYLTSSDLQEGLSSPHAIAGLVGTSMAAPHVSGAAAVLWANHAHLSARQVRSGLLAMADDRGQPGPDPYFGFGRLNFQRAFTGDRHDAR